MDDFREPTRPQPPEEQPTPPPPVPEEPSSTAVNLDHEGGPPIPPQEPQAPRTTGGEWGYAQEERPPRPEPPAGEGYRPQQPSGYPYGPAGGQGYSAPGYGGPSAYPPAQRSGNGYPLTGYPPPQQPYPPAYQPDYRTGGYGPYMPPVHPLPKRSNPHRKAVRRNANIVGVGLILMILLGSILLPLLFYSLDYIIPARIFQEYPVIDEILDLINYVGMFLIPILLLQRWIRIPARVAYPIRKASPLLVIPAIFVMLGASFVGGLISHWIQLSFTEWFGLRPTMPDMYPPEGIGPIVVYCISLAIAPAILEEMLFRGVIMQSLRRFGDGFALVVSSILFAVGHGNLIQGPTSLMSGLVIGYVVLRTGSLLSGMIMHFANNGMVVVMELLVDYGPPQMEYITDMAYLLMATLFAVICLVFLMVRYKNMFRLLPSAYPLEEGVKYRMFFTSWAPIAFLFIMIVITSMYFTIA